MKTVQYAIINGEDHTTATSELFDTFEAAKEWLTKNGCEEKAGVWFNDYKDIPDAFMKFLKIKGPKEYYIIAVTPIVEEDTYTIREAFSIAEKAGAVCYSVYYVKNSCGSYATQIGFYSNNTHNMDDRREQVGWYDINTEVYHSSVLTLIFSGTTNFGNYEKCGEGYSELKKL
jgi:hypothetical protein